MIDYQTFLKRKLTKHEATGFDVALEDTNPLLFDWQRVIARWAIAKGRGAIFADCGLGKTNIQLEWSKHVCEHENRPVLIVAPLAVAQQTRREGERFGYEVNVCRKQADVKNGINICNYEMLNYFDADAFAGVVIDESGILKNFTGKTKRQITGMFADVPFRLSCTATPAPNDLMELLNQAEFLGVMKSNEALACWFIADQKEMGSYRLKKHAEKDFWHWVSSWAVCMEKPSDIGYSDEGYVLPSLHEMTVVVDRDVKVDPMQELTETINMNATSYQREKRKTIENRVKAVADIVNHSDEQFLVWCYLNDEATALKAALQDCVEVRGSDKTETKENAVVDFANGDVRVLVSKPSIFGWGINWQNCHNMIFCGMDYSFESYYQAVRRVYRFGQEEEVNVWRVIGKNEKVILDAINRKKKIKDDMAQSMAIAMRDFQTDEIKGKQFRLEFGTQTATMPDWLRSEVC